LDVTNFSSEPLVANRIATNAKQLGDFALVQKRIQLHVQNSVGDESVMDMIVFGVTVFGTHDFSRSSMREVEMILKLGRFKSVALHLWDTAVARFAMCPAALLCIAL